VLHDGAQALSRLVSQVSNPVRWDACMATLVDLGVTGMLELAPAGTLTGLAKRAMPGVQTVALKTPDDLDAARSLVAEHAGSAPAEPATWRLVVSPARGVLRRLGPDGGEVTRQAPLAAVEDLEQVREVLAPRDATIVEWLVHDGDPVAAGQPLLRIHPTRGTE
jgi:[acyl-carrier-protein] S-malonyltransferase